MWQKLIFSIGEYASHMLAILGLVGVAYTVFTYPDNFVTSLFEKAFDFDATVRPTCEPLASLDIRYSDGTPAEAKLIGLTIRSQNDISNISFRISDIAYVDNWSIESNSLPKEEADSIAKHLPVGAITSAHIFGKIPRLISNSETTIQLQGLTKKQFDCSNEWFNLSAPSRKIAQLVFSNSLQIRDSQYGIHVNNIYKKLSFVLLIVVLGLIALRVTNKEEPLKKRFRIRKKL